MANIISREEYAERVRVTMSEENPEMLNFLDNMKEVFGESSIRVVNMTIKGEAIAAVVAKKFQN